MIESEVFLDLEKIGIEDAPDVTEDDDDGEWIWGKIQRNQDERVNCGTVEKMDFEKISKRNRKLKALKDPEKMPGKGTPSETEEFWFQGTEFVDLK
ncbi:MAG: hypothetical protein GY696_03170 [Gammaproteobacteria bacterium]|nr:hypothetical protein [Gammaproteobacteria bacterium]